MRPLVLSLLLGFPWHVDGRVHLPAPLWADTDNRAGRRAGRARRRRLRQSQVGTRR